MLPLAAALEEAARAVRPCSRCGNLDSRDPCAICADPRRDRTLICVVEGVADLWALERAGVHRGLYHVLGGTLSALDGVGPDDLNLAPLLARIARAEQVREVILALGATVEGASTAHWLAERLAPVGRAVDAAGAGGADRRRARRAGRGHAGDGAAGAAAGGVGRKQGRGLPLRGHSNWPKAATLEPWPAPPRTPPKARLWRPSHTSCSRSAPRWRTRARRPRPPATPPRKAAFPCSACGPR